MVDRRVVWLDRLRRAAGAGGIAEMSLEDIRRARESRLPELPGLDPVIQRLGLWLLGGPRPGVTIDELSVPGPAGDLKVRRYTPPQRAEPAPLVVWLHGGGWVLGRPHQYDWVCSAIAGDAGAVVASVDYRLAPEQPAPAAVEDAVAATTWLAEHGAVVGATGPLVVAGDSAGGNLAALVAVATRDAGGPDVALQALVYPGIDLTRSFPSIHALGDAPMLTRPDIDAFVGHYLGGTAIAADDPRVSPWFVEDLSGLAPALVQTAEADPLRDEGRAYASRLRDAGVATRHTEYVGMPHGFLSLPGICPAATQAVAEIVQTIADLPLR